MYFWDNPLSSNPIETGDAVWFLGVFEKKKKKKPVAGVVTMMFPPHRRARYGVELEDGRFVHASEQEVTLRGV